MSKCIERRISISRSVFWVEQKATGGHQIWSGTVAGNTPKVAVLTSDLTRPKNLVYDYKTDRYIVMFLWGIGRRGVSKWSVLREGTPFLLRMYSQSHLELASVLRQSCTLLLSVCPLPFFFLSKQAVLDLLQLLHICFIMVNYPVFAEISLG